MTSYLCRCCNSECEATASDLDVARADEREAMQYDGDLLASDSDAELMDRFGRDICNACAPELIEA